MLVLFLITLFHSETLTWSFLVNIISNQSSEYWNWKESAEAKVKKASRVTEKLGTGGSWRNSKFVWSRWFDMIIFDIIIFLTWCIYGSSLGEVTDRTPGSVPWGRSPGMVKLYSRCLELESRQAGREVWQEVTLFVWFFQVVGEFLTWGDTQEQMRNR